jgi:hypothetical protein
MRVLEMSTDSQQTDEQELDSNTDEIEAEHRRAQESGEVFEGGPHSER